MPTRMDAAAAAARIRGRLQQPEPQDRHVEAFAKKVCSHLGIEPNAYNVSMVVNALHHADIEPHQMQEYPKAIQREGIDPKTDKSYPQIVVQNEQEEHDVQDKWTAGEDAGAPVVQTEYPKMIMIRGTDGHDHPVQVRDRKEERELLGLDHNPVQGSAPTHEDIARLPPVTGEELDAHQRLTDGAEQNVEALEQANETAKAQPQEFPEAGGGQLRPAPKPPVAPTRPKLR